MAADQQMTEMGRRIDRLAAAAHARIEAAGGEVPLRDMLDHLAALDRSDALISRALAREQSFHRMRLTLDRTLVTLPRELTS